MAADLVDVVVVFDDVCFLEDILHGRVAVVGILSLTLGRDLEVQCDTAGDRLWHLAANRFELPVKRIDLCLDRCRNIHATAFSRLPPVLLARHLAFEGELKRFDRRVTHTVRVTQ